MATQETEETEATEETAEASTEEVEQKEAPVEAPVAKEEPEPEEASPPEPDTPPPAEEKAEAPSEPPPAKEATSEEDKMLEEAKAALANMSEEEEAEEAEKEDEASEDEDPEESDHSSYPQIHPKIPIGIGMLGIFLGIAGIHLNMKSAEELSMLKEEYKTLQKSVTKGSAQDIPQLAGHLSSFKNNDQLLEKKLSSLDQATIQSLHTLENNVRETLKKLDWNTETIHVINLTIGKLFKENIEDNRNAFAAQLPTPSSEDVAVLQTPSTLIQVDEKLSFTAPKVTSKSKPADNVEKHTKTKQASDHHETQHSQEGADETHHDVTANNTTPPPQPTTTAVANPQQPLKQAAPPNTPKPNIAVTTPSKPQPVTKQPISTPNAPRNTLPPQTTAITPNPAPTPSQSQPSAPPPPPAPVVSKPATHTYRSGESLSQIAKKYNVSLRKLFNANPDIDPRDIPDGQVIILP